MIEVAKLFIAIFITLTPIVDLLHLGEHGPFAAILRVVSDESAHPIPLMYFWVTGVLSSFLDNAPTYLVFFNLLGGDALQAMQQNATTLAAISAGAVFMGANTYIGNAPNLMIKSIATIQGVQMPSFLGYMGWVSVVLLPAFLIISWIFFSI
jgi:Na+/H+ antiporter NhaD/arsenite permease-like protein